MKYMRCKEMLKAIKMKKHNFPESIICQFESIDTENARSFVEKMDELLTEEQRLLLHEYGGSCRGGETGRQCKILAKELAGKTLSEKIVLMNKNNHIYRTRLNEDGTMLVRAHYVQTNFLAENKAASPRV